MPPKKATATKAKATPARAAANATAASERPRRAAAKDAPAPTSAKKAPAKKAPTKAAAKTATPAPKKRGRAAKTEETDVDDELDVEEPPKKRGRPAKAEAKPDATAEPPKKRGPPVKKAAATEDAQAVPEDETAPPKKRGRPPKGGETTKIAEDDPAAAGQLEDELVDAAEAEENEAPSKRAPPAKKGKGSAKGKGRAGEASEEGSDNVDDVDAVAHASAAADDVPAGEENEGEAEGSGNYWLMKAEQIDREETLQDGSVFNTKFTIDDLREKAGPEPWDGVRNPTACKNMREMKLGDLAFFYASGGKGKLQPGITGIMEIVKEHEPDMSAFDENHPYYVTNPKQRGTKDKPRWSLVHVEFRKKLSTPVSLKELQKFKHDSGVLANMQEFTAARLSVSKVTAVEWNFIVNNLVEGYEKKAGDVTLDTAATTKAEDAAAADPPVVDGDVITTTKTQDVAMADTPILNDDIAADDVVPTSETVAPSLDVTGTSRPSTRKPSSRPTSRVASRAGSRAGSKPPAANIVDGGLAPPRVQSRGRSRTPAARAGSVQPLNGVAEEIETVEE